MSAPSILSILMYDRSEEYFEWLEQHHAEIGQDPFAKYGTEEAVDRVFCRQYLTAALSALEEWEQQPITPQPFDPAHVSGADKQHQPGGDPVRT